MCKGLICIYTQPVNVSLSPALLCCVYVMRLMRNGGGNLRVRRRFFFVLSRRRSAYPWKRNVCQWHWHRKIREIQVEGCYMFKLPHRPALPLKKNSFNCIYRVTQYEKKWSFSWICVRCLAPNVIYISQLDGRQENAAVDFRQISNHIATESSINAFRIFYTQCCAAAAVCQLLLYIHYTKLCFPKVSFPFGRSPCNCTDPFHSEKKYTHTHTWI